MMIRTLSLTLTALALLPMTGCCDPASLDDSLAEEIEQSHRIEAAIRKLDVDFNFYGKVVDQHGEPVAGVSVLASVGSYSPSWRDFFGTEKTVRAKTDKKGLFTIKKNKGRALEIDKISLLGYELHWEQNPVRAFDFSAMEGTVEKPFVPDRNNPVVFRLRKKGTPVYCVENPHFKRNTANSESGQPLGYDFIRQLAIRDLKSSTFNGYYQECDLLMTAVMKEAGAVWEVTLESGSTNGGVIASYELLYEAPATGYKKAFTFTARGREKPEYRYLYVKSRDPAIYTRMELDQFVQSGRFALWAKTVTNPYGERNLEALDAGDGAEADIDGDIRGILRGEVRTAYERGQRPKKPDLAKLIEEYKKRPKD